MAQAVGRYVYVLDRREVAETRRRDLLAFADEFGTAPHVEFVFSGERGQRQSIARRIVDTGIDVFANRHAVLMITHAGMKKVDDWGHFADWNAIFIDEIPSILEHEAHFTTAFEAAGLAAHYDLTPIGESESKISFMGGFNAHDLSRSSPHWVKFHQRALTGDARCDLLSWDDIEERPDWSSWTIWDPTKLGVFGEARILGDSFTDTDTFHLMQRRGLAFERFNVAQPRPWAKRQVTIRYATEAQPASSSKLKNEANKAELAKIGAWLAAVRTDQHIWTCNADSGIVSALTAAHILGERLTPKQAGSNKYRHIHAASAIYSAKPSPQERRFFGHLGIDPDVIVRSRETYDLKQFIMRTSLRMPESTAPVELRVLDKWQAEALGSYLRESYGLEPVLVFDDIGLAFETKKRGRPATGRAMTREERREANRRSQQQSRERRNSLAMVAAR